MNEAAALVRRPTLEAAAALLGARLVRDADPASVDSPRRVGRIVELEAYIGEEDRASHARFGRTARNAVMHGPPGIAYVYLVYGMYDCLNIVTEPDGRPAALLVRAVEPLEGIEAMRSARLASWRRRRKRPNGEAEVIEAARLGRLPADRLASGPGLVAAAFGIDRTMTGLDLLDPSSSLRIEAAPPGEPRPPIETTSRVGIDFAGTPWTDMPWRFVITGHPSLSG